MFSKKASLEFEGINTINSTAYLSEMLKKLEDPPLVNALEVEARDLVKSRLELISEELRQLKSRKKQERKRSCKANASQKTMIYLFRLEEQEVLYLFIL